MGTDIDSLLSGALGAGGTSALRGPATEASRPRLERRTVGRGDSADTATASPSPEPQAAVVARCRAAARQEDGTIDTAAFARCMADARRSSEVIWPLGDRRPARWSAPTWSPTGYAWAQVGWREPAQFGPDHK